MTSGGKGYVHVLTNLNNSRIIIHYPQDFVKIKGAQILDP